MIVAIITVFILMPFVYAFVLTLNEKLKPSKKGAIVSFIISFGGVVGLISEYNVEPNFLSHWDIILGTLFFLAFGMIEMYRLKQQ